MAVESSRGYISFPPINVGVNKNVSLVWNSIYMYMFANHSHSPVQPNANNHDMNSKKLQASLPPPPHPHLLNRPFFLFPKITPSSRS